MYIRRMTEAALTLKHVLAVLSARVQLLYSESSALLVPAAFFLLLAVLVHRKRLREKLDELSPASVKVNVLVYVTDVLLVLPPLAYLLAELSAFIARHGLALVDAASFASMPAVCVLLMAVFIGDAIGYFRHRLEHSPLLWPSHALHHSDQAMNWFTLFRFHPINRLTTVLIDNGILLAIGFPGWAILLNGLVRQYYGMLIHADLPWTFGVFGRVFVSPAMHRWHHVLKGRGVGSNFATVFSIFDQCFKTYYVPGPCDQPLGVEGARHDAFVGQLMYPFAALYEYGKTARSEVTRRRA